MPNGPASQLVVNVTKPLTSRIRRILGKEKNLTCSPPQAGQQLEEYEFRILHSRVLKQTVSGLAVRVPFAQPQIT
jgi:hypothetical protein